MKGFIHSNVNEDSTVQQLRLLHGRVGPTEMLSCFAYATYSGAVRFDMELGPALWGAIETKWLFGIDYGRTQPSALHYMAAKQNAEVRIQDGVYVVESKNFIPRRDFHMKSAFMLNRAEQRFGFLAGSGNFSSSGLLRNIECGASLVANSADEFATSFERTYREARRLWDDATLLNDIIGSYEENWSAEQPQIDDEGEEPEVFPDQFDSFWIESGYVTRNRGSVRPGNQIDMPRGMHRYFGMAEPPNIERNDVIGEIRFIPPSGEEVARNLRLGNNLMEKITLPIPEQHGLDIYDGKVLLFRREDLNHRIWALEVDDFRNTFGSRLAGVKIMASGRRYGYIKP